MKSLLYWDSLLSAIKLNFPNFKVFTAFPSLETNDKAIITENVLYGLKLYRKSGSKDAYLFYLPLPFFLIRVLRERPNLVIINEFNLTCVYFCVINKFILKAKVLLLVESDPFLGYQNKHSCFRNVIRKFVAKQSDLILTNNKLGFNYLNKILNVDSGKIRQMVYLTSEPPVSKNGGESFYVDPVKVRFLYVGQIIARKGLIYLLQAINRLPRNLKRMIHFDIVGSGNQLKELQMFKKENELDCVFFRGEVEYNQISRYYKDADCFILNTLHDYRALVGFEALFNGCAIIASEFDGARNEIVHEGYNGFIVNPFDVEAIKRTFLTILDNRENLINFKEYSLLLSLNYSREKSEFAMISVIKELI